MQSLTTLRAPTWRRRLNGFPVLAKSNLCHADTSAPPILMVLPLFRVIRGTKQLDVGDGNEA